MYPESLGRYRLLERLGRGGQGEVWLAESLERPGARVAVKTLHPDEEQPSSSRLLDEARIGARVKPHPNVVRLLDVGLEDAHLFLVMELLEGRTLAQLERGEPLPPELVVGLALQVLAALEHLQQLELVHRDLKPSNLFLTRDGVVKLIDFGIARAQGVESTTTRSGAIRGTVAYLSPEQARGERPDVRSDLYALGVVMHELLTGRPLFDQPIVAAQLSAILFGAVAPVSSVRPDVPPALDRAIAQALAKEPAHRPQSPRDFALALREAIAPVEPWAEEQLAEWVAGQGSASQGAPPTASFSSPRTVDPAPSAPGRGISTLQRRLFAGVVAIVAVLSGMLAVRFVVRVTRSEPAEPQPEVVEPAAAAADTEPGVDEPAGAPRRAPRPAPRLTAFATIDSRPVWANVTIDGKHLGPTPLVRVPLAPGAHQLEAVTERGKKKSLKLRLLDGREEKILLEW